MIFHDGYVEISGHCRERRGGDGGKGGGIKLLKITQFPVSSWHDSLGVVMLPEVWNICDTPARNVFVTLPCTRCVTVKGS